MLEQPAHFVALLNLICSPAIYITSNISEKEKLHIVCFSLTINHTRTLVQHAIKNIY
jgi:hypothetical protein